MNKKIFFSTLFLLGLLFLSKKTAIAQSELRLNISPPISYLKVPPGTSQIHTIILENDSDNTIDISPSIVDFSSDGKTGRVILSDKLSFPYISFENKDLEKLSIPAHKKTQFSLKIDVPKDADEKEYPMTILFFTKENGHINSDAYNFFQSQISGGIGSNLVVFTSKKSNLGQLIKIIDLNTPKIIDSFGKIEFSPLVKNDDLASYSASGSAKIINWQNNQEVNFEIYPDVILGSSSRELRALRPGVSKDKPETGSFSYKPKFLIGPYKIKINLISENGNITEYQEHIYAFPFSITLIITIGIIISLIYFKKLRHYFTSFLE